MSIWVSVFLRKLFLEGEIVNFGNGICLFGGENKRGGYLNIAKAKIMLIFNCLLKIRLKVDFVTTKDTKIYS